MDLIKRNLGKYEIVELLGQGGMAEVYKAHQPGLDRFVAIKVMHRHLATSPDFVTRFQREAQSIGQLQHPHIIHVIDFDIEDNIYYLVMDYIQGDTLNEYLGRTDALSTKEALSITVQLADALDYAHRQGMIHRDIKPANVMFRDESQSQVVLTDFGMARLMDDTGLTLPGALVGTPAYMSPEAVRSEQVDERSDIYSLGLILYEMITGTPPYPGDSALAIIMKQANDPLPPPRRFRPDLPEAVERLLYKALAKDPADRFQNAARFREAIFQALPTLPAGPITPPSSSDQAQTVMSPPISLPGQKDTAPPKPWLLWAMVAGGTLLVIVLMAISFIFGQQNNAQTGNQEILAVEAGTPAGFLRFADNEASRAGDFILQINGVSPPPAGSHYALWVTDDDEQNRLNLIDQLPVNNGQINVAGSTEQNLLGAYRRVIITLEADDDPDTAMADTIAFAGELPAAVVEPLRQIIVETSLNDTGLLPGAQDQLRLAIDHTGFLITALAAADLTEASRHAEHVVNILDGENGSQFGDVDGDGRPQNPGDGVGVNTYLENVVEQVGLAATGTGLTVDRQRYAGQIGQTGANHLALLEEAIDLAAKIPAADTVAEAQTSADALEALLDQVLNGADLDGNGVIDPTKNEGGVLSLYEDALMLSEIAIFAGE